MKVNMTQLEKTVDKLADTFRNADQGDFSAAQMMLRASFEVLTDLASQLNEPGSLIPTIYKIQEVEKELEEIEKRIGW